MEDPGTDPTRETLTTPQVVAYLRDGLAACGFDVRRLAGDGTLTRLTGGHSNLTYLLRFGTIELVLRRPPAGPLPPSAHDMAREYRWLTALSPICPLVPKPYLLCEDHSVAGSVFYVMERRHGVVLRHDEPARLAERPDERHRVSEALVDALVDLHAVDIEAHHLSGMGKPQGFVARQVDGWTDRWHRAQTTPLPILDATAAWLAAHMPPDPPAPTIVHGDFKLDNVMLADDDLAHVVAVLDWEMCALGDPLVDLGVLLAYWGPTAPPGYGDGATPFTERGGWLTRAGLIERYVARSHRDVTDIQFYEVFALFKVAIVVQQLFFRYSRGDTTDPRFARFDARVTYLAGRAAACIEQA